MGVLVTTAESPKALTVMRSLGRKGIGVTAGSDEISPLSSASRYCSGKFRYRNPRLSPRNFVSDLSEFLSRNNHEALIPVHSADTYIIAEFKDRLSRFTRIPIHDYICIREMNNKASLMRTARDMGITVPETFIIDDIPQLKDISRKVNYPIVIKMRESSGSRGVRYAGSSDELMKIYTSMVNHNHLSLGEYPIIQEYIKGDGYGVSLLFNQGDLRARFTHRRLREYPVSGGPSTYRESVVHPGMEKIAVDLLEHYNWHGLAMVEFKLRASDKRPVLLEVNPRFWGSINQAILAGVDFPYLLYRMAVDGDVAPVFNYHTGIKSRNCFSDLMSIASYLRNSGKVRNLTETTLLPFNDDILAIDDPKPMIQFLFSGLKHVIG